MAKKDMTNTYQKGKVLQLSDKNESWLQESRKNRKPAKGKKAPAKGKKATRSLPPAQEVAMEVEFEQFKHDHPNKVRCNKCHKPFVLGSTRGICYDCSYCTGCCQCEDSDWLTGWDMVAYIMDKHPWQYSFRGQDASRVASSEQELRKGLIRLAHEHPEYQDTLLPLLKRASPPPQSGG